MAHYTFRIGSREVTVEAFDLDEALRWAGIRKGDTCKLLEVDDPGDTHPLFAVTDRMAVGM